MLVEPVPGANRDQLIGTLREIHADLVNLRPRVGDIHEGYLGWANDAARKISTLVTPATVDRLILTSRYWALLSMSVSQPAHWASRTEVDERAQALDGAIRALEEAVARWSRPGRYVVPDSSFYVTHPEKIEDADFRPLISIREDEVHIVVPMAVIDELDRLKNSGSQFVRWRAGYTLAVLDDRLRNPNHPTRLREEDFTPVNTGGIPSGEITVEVLFDLPGHVRLPIIDDEIIDQALSVQGFTGAVTLITYDTGQAMRARHAGLNSVTKLDVPRDKTEPKRKS